MPQTVPRPIAPAPQQEQALIPEARRLRRRRWAIGTAIVAMLGLIAGLLTASLNSAPTPSPRATGSMADAPPTGALTSLHLAGALAVSRNGELYVADTPLDRAGFQQLDADRVLVRLADGRFRIVASGLSYISDLAVGPSGALYIADAGRVQEIGHDGVLRTIAGNGHAPPISHQTGPLPISAATRALAAPLGSSRPTGKGEIPLHIALSPSGQLYISNEVQVLRLTARGTLEPIKATVTPAHGLPGGQLNGIGPIAIAANSTIYVGGEMWGWSLWAVDANGTARYLAFARQSGGNNVDVQSGPHGSVFTANGDGIRVIKDGRPQTVFEFNHKIDGQYFALTNFAIAPDGVTYADEIPGGYGFEAHQQLVAVHNHHVILLWQEKNRTPR